MANRYTCDGLTFQTRAQAEMYQAGLIYRAYNRAHDNGASDNEARAAAEVAGLDAPIKRTVQS